MIVTSGDGYHWTNQTYGAFPALLGVGYSSGTYAAAGVSGTILTSSNDINWIQRKLGKILKSADGTNWVSSANVLPLFESAWFLYYQHRRSPILCAPGGSFIAGGHDGILMRSGDTRVPILADSPRVSDSGFGFSFTPQSANLIAFRCPRILSSGRIFTRMWLPHSRRHSTIPAPQSHQSAFSASFRPDHAFGMIPVFTCTTGV